MSSNNNNNKPENSADMDKTIMAKPDDSLSAADKTVFRKTVAPSTDEQAQAEDDAKTVFRKPISDNKAQEIAKSVALAKAKAAAAKAQAQVQPANDKVDANTTGDSKATSTPDKPVVDVNDDRTVFSPRVPPQASAEAENNAMDDADKTVFAKPLSSQTVQAPSTAPHDDATVFSPRPVGQHVDQHQAQAAQDGHSSLAGDALTGGDFNANTANTGDTGSAFDLINSAVDISDNSSETSSTEGHSASFEQAPTQSVAGNANPKMLKNRFVLEDILGIGGMGVVYKAKDLLKVEAQDKDPYVAIKVLSEEFRTHPEAFISLQREAKKAQHIANQNTVKVYDFDRDGEVVFMTMEYMIGQPLDQMVKQYHATGLPPNETWTILHGMCLALIHAHNEDIVHSDLKPGNVFVTDNGVAKIFDFGIARAVQKIDRSQSEKDRTVFDAGNLGALTPAYASREMLLGQVPDVRDDIYALGCIAYEMLTGDHPFSRLPADEAYDKKLKPKRIQGIKKRHWKAIEAALAFERKDRIISVEAFYNEITDKKKANGAIGIVMALALAGSAFGYYEYTKIEDPGISQAELMNQMEFKIRYEVLQENIERFIAAPSFSREWQASLWEEMQSMQELFPEKPTPWYFTKREVVYQLYLEKIALAIGEANFTQADNLISQASRYTDEQALLDKHKFTLAQKIAEKETADKKAAEASRLAAITQKKKAIAQAKIDKANKAQQAKVATSKKNTNLYNLALDNVTEQLNCTSRLNMRDFKIAIEKLRTLDNARYQKVESSITSSLATCITTMGQVSPDYAKDAKRYAMLLFNNNSDIASVVIKEKDGCQLSIAGLGARGSRAACKDSLKVGGTGPTMVVIPGTEKMKPFAIGRYEVSISQYNLYCTKSKACSPIVTESTRLPVTNISVAQMNDYIQWLSTTTGKKYRLPHKREWLHAAQSQGNKLDSNRNCQISSRGISKGDELIKTTTGKQNTWGMVNYAGNAQELAYLSGKRVAAFGGSYKTAMDNCTNETMESHTGKADEHTGFRLVRELTQN